MDGLAGQTLAAYLTSYFLARYGYSRQVPPEAADLAAACDAVLTRLNLGALEIVCFVDCQAHPGKQFGLPPERVREIAKACRKYSGTFNLSRMPITVEIIEIGGDPASDEDKRRLRHYRRSSIFSQAFVFAARIDARTKQIWRNRWRLGRSRVARILDKPPVPEAELRAEIEDRPPLLAPAPAVVTYGILVLLAAVFAIETYLSDGAQPSTITLISLGGLNAKLVVAGEWWRVISATLLHIDLSHIFANSLALYVGGRVLESMVGRTWFAATYIVAAIAGSVASLAGGAHFTVAVGASGAVMGVIAAAAICGLVRRRAAFGAASIQLLFSLVPTLGLAIWGGPSAANIDHFAHYGGALGGAATALAMLAVWRRNESLPSARTLAACVAGLGGLAVILAAIEVAAVRSQYAVVLLPARALDGGPQMQASLAARAVESYPDDPRSYFAMGIVEMRQNNWAGAEAAFRIALSKDKTLALYYPPTFANQVRAALAVTLLARNNRTAATEVAEPLCALPAGSPLLDSYAKQVLPRICK